MLNQSAIGTLVERATRYVMLVHLPDSHTADAVRDGLVAAIPTLPEHLRERVAGLLALVHGATSTQIRNLRVTDITADLSHLTFQRRPHPIPLDPPTADGINAALIARSKMRTENPHLLITKDSLMHATACSPYFMTHVLDSAGTTPAVLRYTRLADMAHALDPRLVAAAFGMTNGGASYYVRDAVDDEEHVFRRDL